MTANFSPEDLKVHSEEGALNFSDAWGLTCAQLGLTLGQLLEVRPDAQLTKDDLVGYHFIQYGMDPEVTEETIEAMVSGNSTWNNWD